jgi:hypothetical protein
MVVDVTDVELNSLFGHLGDWAQFMISRDLRHLQTESSALKDRPKLVGSEAEAGLIEFALRRQLERNAPKLMRKAGKQLDRFWVHRFLELNRDNYTLSKVAFREK